VINKIDLAPYVGANLDIMDSDTKKMRPNSPYVFSNLHKDVGLNDIISFIVDKGMLKT
jgi:urease accessory protein